MLRQRQQRTTLLAFLAGCAATGLALAAYSWGWLDSAEYKTVDWRFRYPQFNSIPFSDELTSIDIDDTSLALVGRWPWPRDVQAALISVPARCGARAILVDLDWSEREVPRLDWPSDADLTRLSPDDPSLGDLRPTDPDRELRAAIVEAPPVFPAFSNFVSGRIEESPDFATALLDVISGRPAETQPLEDLATGAPTASEHLKVRDRLRLASFFYELPEQPDAAAAVALSLPLAQVAEASLACRLAALRVELGRWWSADPARRELSSDELLYSFYAHVSGRDYFDSGPNPLKEAVAATVRNDLSYRTTMREPLMTDERAQQIALPVQAVLPVHFVIAEPCRRPGFVNFRPDEADGVFRRETLFERHGTVQTVQLALAVACELWGIKRIETSGPEQVVLEPPGLPPVSIQLDRRHQVIVPWTTSARMHEVSRRFIPAVKLCEVQTLETRMEANAAMARAALKAIVAQPGYQSQASVADIVDAVELAGARVRAARRANQPQTLAASRQMLAEWEGKLVQARAGLFEIRSRLRANSESQPAVDEPGEQEFELLDQIAAANARLKKDRDELLADLRRRIEGKICLIGYTATALADMKPTPLSGSMPGVRAHLNLLNGLLQNRTVSWLSTGQNALIAALAGLLVSLVSAFRRRLALPVMLMAVAALICVATLAFFAKTLLVGVVPPITAMLLSYVVVALFQFSFVDRERRELTKTLGQYTSATLARRMAEQPELCRRAEVREVSSVFTDLEGFTSLSEVIGAERTQHLLNVSLGRFSEVLLRHEAMINKFMGDGVFAFWNPLINPQSDHAVRACASAIEMLDELGKLAVERQAAGDDSAFSQLRLRIGLAAGNAVVGPCGSEQKYDYTCIGDSVNLAARLEAANKVFGTRILTNDRIRELAGPDFAFRTLGRLQVKGKAIDVPIFELLGRNGAVPPAGDGVARFEEALGHFQARRFEEALRLFERVRELRPGDKAVELYVSTAQRFIATPPPADWHGALELTEK